MDVLVVVVVVGTVDVQSGPSKAGSATTGKPKMSTDSTSAASSTTSASAQPVTDSLPAVDTVESSRNSPKLPEYTALNRIVLSAGTSPALDPPGHSKSGTGALTLYVARVKSHQLSVPAITARIASAAATMPRSPNQRGR